MKHFKVDYISGIWKNHSLHEVADEYQLRDSIFSSYFEDMFQTSIGGEGWFCYIYNGIKIFVPTVDASSVPKELWSTPKFYDLHFPRIKVDFSGQGLDWYRNLLGKPIEDFFRQPKADFRPTRVDFAVDFINEHSDLFDSMKSYLTDLAMHKKERVYCAGMRGGCTYELKLGQQHTIYLGGSSGDILLRIYDKKMEMTDEFGCWKIKPPYLGLDQDGSSWIRFELQCRRDAATSVLYHPVVDESNHPIYDADGSICQLPEELDQWALTNYKTLITRYSFRDMGKSIDHKEAEILPFWKEFLTEIENKVAVLQISHFVQFTKPMDRVEKNIRKYSNSAIAFIAVYGLPAYIQLLSDILEQQQKKKVDPGSSELDHALKHNSLIITLQSVSNNLEDFPGLQVYNNQLKLKCSVTGLDGIRCLTKENISA